MVFSSITFLCLFLPVTLLVYYLVPAKVKNIWLLIASLIFYAFGEPIYICLLLASILLNYFGGLFIARSEKASLRRLFLILCLVFNLGALAVFKYLPLGLSLPIGISFYTFQGISYIVDVYRKKVEVQRNPLYFGMYISLFPQLIAGPIVRYSDVAAEISDRKITKEMLGDGMERFVLGLGKKILIANICGEMVEKITTIQTAGCGTVPLAWLSAAAYMLQIYFDFSAYSDMAIGIGKMLGFHFPENFNYPYEAKSITEFWSRWHMTLSSFFKEYVYIPLGGNRKGTARQILNLVIVWGLTGLWHGAGINFVLWGLYYCAFLILEKFVLKRLCAKWPVWIKHLYTLFVVLIGWVLFAHESLTEFGTELANLFGGGVNATTDSSFYLMEYGLPLILFAALATHFPRKLYEKFPMAVRLILGLVIFGFSVAFLISGSYNPFLYFRF